MRKSTFCRADIAGVEKNLLDAQDTITGAAHHAKCARHNMNARSPVKLIGETDNAFVECAGADDDLEDVEPGSATSLMQRLRRASADAASILVGSNVGRELIARISPRLRARDT